MNDLINTLHMYAEDMHSAFGHGYCSEAMSRAAGLLEAQVGTITALNIALGGKDSTSTENLVDSHEIDIADVGLITMCRKLMAENFELEASPLSEEALDILRSKNKQLEAELADADFELTAIEAALKDVPYKGNLVGRIEYLKRENSQLKTSLLRIGNDLVRRAIEIEKESL